LNPLAERTRFPQVNQLDPAGLTPLELAWDWDEGRACGRELESACKAGQGAYDRGALDWAKPPGGGTKPKQKDGVVRVNAVYPAPGAGGAPTASPGARARASANTVDASGNRATAAAAAVPLPLPEAGGECDQARRGRGPSAIIPQHSRLHGESL
jgi:hypothetical protein